MKLLLKLLIGILFVFSRAKASDIQTGKASWYSVNCNGGTKTASGKKLKNNEMTAAHRTLPFGTIVKITNTSNGKSVNCTISDRGPYKKGRIIDVTSGAAEMLGFKSKGITTVRVEVVKRLDKKP